MARRKGFVYALAQAQREAERKRVAQIKAQTQAARAAERAQREYGKALRADQKEQARLYTESQIAQVNLQNEQLEQGIARLNNLLAKTLSRDSYLDLQTLKQPPQFPIFNPGPLAIAEPAPSWQAYMPPEPTGFQRLLPGAKEKYTQEVAKAQELFRQHQAAHSAQEAMRQRTLYEARARFERHVAEIQQQVAAQHAEIDTLQRSLLAHSPSAIEDYFTMVLDSSPYPEDNFPQQSKLAYVPESKQLVVEYDLPPFEVVPTVGAYKYTKTKDEITETTRPLTQRKALYSSVVAQLTLRTLHELFKADRLGQVDIIVFNGL